MQWAIADGLGLILKDSPETCHHNFDPSKWRWFPRFGTPRGIIRMELGRHSTHDILNAPSAISVHGGVLQAQV